jgi:hypothetical protein
VYCGARIFLGAAWWAAGLPPCIPEPVCLGAVLRMLRPDAKRL